MPSLVTQRLAPEYDRHCAWPNLSRHPRLRGRAAAKTWMPGSSPGMTLRVFRYPEVRASASLEG